MKHTPDKEWEQIDKEYPDNLAKFTLPEAMMINEKWKPMNKEEKTQEDFEADAERADDVRQEPETLEERLLKRGFVKIGEEPECPHQTGQVTKDPDGVVWFVCKECEAKFLFDEVIER